MKRYLTLDGLFKETPTSTSSGYLFMCSKIKIIRDGLIEKEMNQPNEKVKK